MIQKSEKWGPQWGNKNALPSPYNYVSNEPA